ncbi:MAG: pseudouridine synthase [Tissierellia bacterium]|nr:pseudouridine synthase [Tissierellia bacterium]
MRLNKFIAKAGICSRRKADELIASGQVMVNGVVVTILGVNIDEQKDLVSIQGKEIKTNKEKVYFVLNKPMGYTTSNADPYAKSLARDLIPYDDHIANVGRLDSDSEGLMIYTTDGEFNYRMTHPKFKVWKKYLVSIDHSMTSDDLRIFKKGIMLEDGITAPCHIKSMNSTATIHEIQIREGKNRQLRRMFQALGYNVVRLIRLSHGEITLGSLPLGETRTFNAAELDYVQRLMKND